MSAGAGEPEADNARIAGPAIKPLTLAFVVLVMKRPVATRCGAYCRQLQIRATLVTLPTVTTTDLLAQ